MKMLLGPIFFIQKFAAVCGHFSFILLTMSVIFLMPSNAIAQTVSQYSNTNVGTISDNNCGTGGQVTRQFNVPTSYIVGDVNLGVLASHSYRSDLRIILTSPQGTSIQVMTWAGNVQSGDNLNDLFDDEAATAISTHVTTAIDPLTPAPPPYSHSFIPSNALSAFDGQNAAGTWTLVVCDAVAADTGQFRRADLFITSTNVSIAKTSTVVSDGVSVSNFKAIPGAIVRYCILVTNNGTSATAPSTNINFTDAIPSNLTYVAGTGASGTSCATTPTPEDDDAVGADETDPFGMSISGSTIIGLATTLSAGETFALTFNARIN